MHMVVSKELSFRIRKAETDLESRANVTPESPAIDWSALRETTLDLAQADMLYIFDCCYKSGSHHATNYELLAATEVIHPIEEEWSHSSNSFTAKLVKVLTILDGEPATVVQIYALLMREAYLDLEKNFTVAPIHRRIPDREFAVKLQPLHTSSIIPEFRLHQLLETAPKVLIRAFVQRPAPGNEMIEWRQFLMDSSPRIPSLEVTVEAVYETDSKTWIIHLLVPVDIWALLWDHQPVLRFEGFVTSGNIKGSLSYVHGPFQTAEHSFQEGGGYLSAIKKEEKYSSESTETAHECQPVSKKEVSPENMDVDHRVLPRDSHSAPSAYHGTLQGSEHVVMGQDELLAVYRIENDMENMDSDSDDGTVQLNNPQGGPDIFVDNISGRLRKRTLSQPGKYKV